MTKTKYIKLGYHTNFCAAHTLTFHEGKCKNVHGHNYDVEVEVSGLIQTKEGTPDYGMVLDFKLFKALVERILMDIDHTDLNKTLINPFAPGLPMYPTVEHIVLYIFSRLEKDLHKFTTDAVLKRVRVYEQENSYAEYSRS